MAKGDRISVGIRNDLGPLTSHEIVAKQNGRSVTSTIENENKVNWLVLQEVTRGGTVIEEVKVQLNDVVLIKTTKKEG